MAFDASILRKMTDVELHFVIEQFGQSGAVGDNIVAMLATALDSPFKGDPHLLADISHALTDYASQELDWRNGVNCLWCGLYHRIAETACPEVVYSSVSEVPILHLPGEEDVPF